MDGRTQNMKNSVTESFSSSKVASTQRRQSALICISLECPSTGVMIRPDLISSGHDQKSIDISPPRIKAVLADCHLIIPEYDYRVPTN